MILQHHVTFEREKLIERNLKNLLPLNNKQRPTKNIARKFPARLSKNFENHTTSPLERTPPKKRGIICARFQRKRILKISSPLKPTPTKKLCGLALGDLTDRSVSLTDRSVRLFSSIILFPLAPVHQITVALIHNNNNKLNQSLDLSFRFSHPWWETFFSI